MNSLDSIDARMQAEQLIGRRVVVTNSEKTWAVGMDGTILSVLEMNHTNYDPLERTACKYQVLLDGLDRNKPPYGKVLFDADEIRLVSDSPKNDPVNHPSHYTDGKYEVIDYIEKCGFYNSFHIGNAVKYISRAGKKDPEKKKEDLEKAIWYLERKLDFDQGKTILDHREEIDTGKYITDKGLDGTAQGMALALLHENRINLAIQALKLEVEGRV